MDIVEVGVGFAGVYLMYRQNKILEAQNLIMQSQSDKPRPGDAQAAKIGKVRMTFRRYWPMVVMALLVILTWLPHFIPSLPQGFQRPRYNTPITISISSTSTPGTLEEIVGKTFEDADVPLDGHTFKNCTFINCCLLYEGGPYVLENATLLKHWHVCVRRSDLGNFQSLSATLGLCVPVNERTVISPPK